jgi:ssDNA-binding Zn-finger/Zn-ribbon topoisomerase 1
MSDLSAAVEATVTCPSCGAQVERTASRCTACGAALERDASERTRDDVELEEGWRAAAAAGYDADFGVEPDLAQCPECGAQFYPGDEGLEGVQVVRDSATGEDDLRVASVVCPRCGTAGRLITAPELLEPTVPDARDDEVWFRAEMPEGATPEHPLGADRRHFEEGGPGNLKDRGSLLDEDGEDIRQYTGEPVETEEGWVLPQQQNVGKENMAGRGEFPDKRAPSAMPKDP